MLDKLNEVHLTILITILTSIVTALAYIYGDANLQEMSNRGLKLSVLLTYIFSLARYLGTKKLDIWKEIIVEKNMAFAMVFSSFILAGAGCLFL